MSSGPQPLDLTECEREPIHIPGAIQPHGTLFVLREPDLVVTQASANADQWVGLPVTEAIGRPIDACLEPHWTDALRATLELEPKTGPGAIALSFGQQFDAVLHRHSGVLVLELERPSTGISPDPSLGGLRRGLVRVAAADSLPELLQIAVTEVQRLTGFERVLAYRFDEDGHGSVEAERKQEGLESYLGLHYPASDIPRQARELYLRNWIRAIPDARYTPVPVVPARRDDGSPLDLSFAHLRSVSPVHLEYLANMGVRASMSVSLVVRGRLWGLISCSHHSGAHAISQPVRAECELVGRLISLQIAALHDREVALRRSERQAPIAKLAAHMRAHDDVLAALLQEPSELLGLLDASGAAFLDENGVQRAGSAPDEAVVRQLAQAIETRGDELFCASTLVGLLDEPSSSSASACGVLSFRLPGRSRGRLLCFRPELRRTVNWGGDPTKPVEGAAQLRLHPRRSFALWSEEVRLRSRPWSESHIEAAKDLRRHAIEIDLAKQVEREQRAVRARDDLVAVVSHDLKNPISVIQMQLAVMLGGSHPDDDARQRRFRAGVERIGRAVERMNSLVHDLLDLAKIEAGRFQLRCQSEPVDEIVSEALALLRPLCDAKQLALVETLEEAGLRVHADRERLFQVLSNLIGNAIRFTPEGGRIALQVGRDPTGPMLEFKVSDTGPGIPPAQVPRLFDRYWQAPDNRRGGTGLGLYIARGIVEAHGGRIELLATASGASFRFTLPREAPKREQLG